MEDWKTVVDQGWELVEDEDRLIGYFSKIAAEHPKSARALFELANALDYASREAEAIPLYEEALRVGLPAEYEGYAWLQLGSSLRNVGRVREAVEVLADAEARFPEVPTISLFLGLALHDEGRQAEALKQVMTAMLRHLHTTDVARYGKGIQHYIAEIQS